jgi:uncharacterized membrane protein
MRTRIAVPLRMRMRKHVGAEQRKASKSRGELENYQALTLDDLTKRNIETIAQLEEAAQRSKTAADRLADKITRFAGSMRFVYLHVVWFAGWILFNSAPFVPESWRIDPFPFTFLTFVVSLEAIFLSTFILITQNHEERLMEKRNLLDLQINLLSEQENSKMLLMLEAIQKRLGIANDDPEVEVLEESTRPDALLNQIETAIENHEGKRTSPKARGQR